MLLECYYMLTTCYFARQSNRSWQKCLLHRAKRGHGDAWGVAWQSDDSDNLETTQTTQTTQQPRPLRIVDLGSCNGFFALKAAYRPAISCHMPCRHGLLVWDWKVRSCHSQAPRSWCGGHWRRHCGNLPKFPKNTRAQQPVNATKFTVDAGGCRMMQDDAGWCGMMQV